MRCLRQNEENDRVTQNLIKIYKFRYDLVLLINYSCYFRSQICSHYKNYFSNNSVNFKFGVDFDIKNKVDII